MRIFETENGSRTHIVRELAYNNIIAPHGLCGAQPVHLTMRAGVMPGAPGDSKDMPTCKRCVVLFEGGAR